MGSVRGLQRGVPRNEKRELRRQQLIDAAILVIGTRGIRDASLDLIAREAGVSHGMVNFHFSSKEKLLLATLSMLADSQLEKLRHKAEAVNDPAHKLRVIMETEFSPSSFSRNEGAVWQDFWNEARSNERVFRICRNYMKEHDALIRDLMREIVAKHDLVDFPFDIAVQTVQSLIDGLWEDYVTLNKPDRKTAVAACMQLMRWMFPMEDVFK